MKVIYVKDYGDKVCLVIDVVSGSIDTEGAGLACDILKIRADEDFDGNIIVGRNENDEILGIIAVVEKDYEPSEETGFKDQARIVYEALQEVLRGDVNEGG